MPQYTSADMIEPQGMLTIGLFPQFVDSTDNFAVFLNALLTRSYAAATAAGVPDATLDAAALAAAYALAYRSVWQRLSATPATASIEGEGARSYLNSQVAAFEKLAAQYQAQYDALIPPVDGALPSGARSTAVRACFSW